MNTTILNATTKSPKISGILLKSGKEIADIGQNNKDISIQVQTKLSKGDFVRFDSTETHYTDYEDIKSKISDEIKL